MGELTDRFVLLALCFLLSFDGTEDSLGVWAFLFILTLGCLCYYMDKPWLRFLYGVIFVALGFFLPTFTAYLPAVFYDLCRVRSKMITVFSATVCAIAILMEGGLSNVVLLVLLALAGALEYRTGQYGDLHEEFKRLRDTSEELNMVLRNKNRALMKKQEYEIQAATLAERNRIAREIHDNVGHMLSRSILQVGAMMAVNEQEDLATPLVELKDTLGTAMDSIRVSVHDLRDRAFVLEDAVNKVIRDYGGCHITFEYDMSEEAEQQVKYCFLAAVKEALTNTAKHSDADSVAIVMREHPAFYQLLIEDNGKKRTASDGEGMGLANMRERTEALGGTIHITGERGFRIFISLPKGGKITN